MRGRRSRGAAAAAALGCAVLAAAPGRARAAEPVPVPERVPLALNFSVAERVTAASVAGAGIFAMAAAPRVFDPPPPSLGPPAAGSFDRRISDALYSGDASGGRFLGRVPDVAGLYVLPYLPALYYGFEVAWIERTGAPWRAGGDVNPDHRLWAYVEALGWTALVTGVTKVVVGRPRPYVVLDHPELAARASEAELSFFSGHSAATFCAASFVALDVSRRLRAGALRNAGGARRFLLGTLAPYAAAYGVASLVGFSRIVDQQHWATDVITGAVVGTTVAHIAYLAHFDGDGRPRRRLGSDPLAAPGGLALVPTPIVAGAQYGGAGIALAGLLP